MSSNPFYVYILRCGDGSFYTGYTDDLELRLREHRRQLKGGAKYTRSHLPVELIYSEPFQTQSEAMKREAEIKKMTRAEKQIVIAGNIKNNI